MPVAASAQAPIAELPSYQPSFAPTSFIDKYRHLLDDDGTESYSEETPRRTAPVLDDEYLSPSQRNDADAEEDTDEALEAYMSNMMRRVRSSGTPAIGANAFAVVAPNASAEQSVAAPPAVEEREMEIDANGMERPIDRKPAVATDLTALRDLANSSARTAIAQHRKRLNVEATVTKGVVCGVALTAAPYLLQRAAGYSSPWFWGACLALVLAGGAAVLLLRSVWQRLTYRVHYATPAAPSSSITTPNAAPRTAAALDDVDGYEADAPG
jgi:hypothetical protein